MTTPPIEVPGFNGGFTAAATSVAMAAPAAGFGRLRNRRDCPWYGRAEYLLWWTKDMPNSTPLVTSVAPGTPTGGTPSPGPSAVPAPP